MRVLIVVYEDKEKRDNLTTRMVDVRMDHVVAEFLRNEVLVQVIRTKEEKWAESDADVEKYPGLKALRSMKEFIEINGEDALLKLLKGD